MLLSLMRQPTASNWVDTHQRYRILSSARTAVYGSYEIIYGNEYFQNRYEASDASPGGGQIYLEGPVYTEYATATSVARNSIVHDQQFERRLLR